jgi:ribulose-phosphate 3-epimerase
VTRARPAVPEGAIAAPSILSADFSRLAEALAIVDPARDWVHCDVMDNHFVPNLTFGPLIVEAVRKLTRAFVDVHLMIHHPERLIGAFADAGADQLTVHVEARHDTDAGGVLRAIRAAGMRPGLSVKPGTPVEALEPHLGALDLLLVMTVEPGFGGQAFIPDMMGKLRRAAAWREARGLGYRIQVDGGVDPETARVCREAGADVFVAGSSVYRAARPIEALAALRKAVGAGG